MEKYPLIRFLHIPLGPDLTLGLDPKDFGEMAFVGIASIQTIEWSEFQQYGHDWMRHVTFDFIGSDSQSFWLRKEEAIHLFEKLESLCFEER